MDELHIKADGSVYLNKTLMGTLNSDKLYLLWESGNQFITVNDHEKEIETMVAEVEEVKNYLKHIRVEASKLENSIVEFLGH